MLSKTSGSALLSALFLMTLIAIAATAMSTRLQMDIYRTRLVIQSDELSLASQAVGFWAMSNLLHPRKKQSAIDNEGKLLDFPLKLKKIYPGVVIQGSLYDLQARFNINNLQNKSFTLTFFNLLKQRNSKVEDKILRSIVKATENWVSPYQMGRGHDELMAYYTHQAPPYLPGYQPMQNISEFRMVAGVTPAIYQAVLPLLTALPTVTGVNLNTVSKPVLSILGNGFSDEQMNAILEFRLEKGEFDQQDLITIINKYNFPPEQVTLESEYFLSVATVSTSDLLLKKYTVFHRTKDRKNGYAVSILSETLNGA